MTENAPAPQSAGHKPPTIFTLYITEEGRNKAISEWRRFYSLLFGHVEVKPSPAFTAKAEITPLPEPTTEAELDKVLADNRVESKNQ